MTKNKYLYSHALLLIYTKMVCKFLSLGAQRTISWHFMAFKIQTYHLYPPFFSNFCFLSHASRWDISTNLGDHYNIIKQYSLLRIKGPSLLKFTFMKLVIRRFLPKTAISFSGNIVTMVCKNILMSRAQCVSHIHLTFWHRSFTFNSNKSPNWCNSFFSLLSWRLFTAQHVSGVFPHIIRSSMTAVAASGFIVVIVVLCSWSGRPASGWWVIWIVRWCTDLQTLNFTFKF